MTSPQQDIEPAEETLPTFSEQVADQLGGIRGMVESVVPVAAFVISNIIWSLTPALIIAVAAAVGLAIFRLLRRQSIRHAVNGLFGIAIGAVVAWRTGNPEDFYLPGILYTLGIGVVMVLSIAIRRPIVGWMWSVVADKGGGRWYSDMGLRRTFGWLTALWATTFFAKVLVNFLVYFSDLSSDEKTSILGIMRIVLGFPPFALLIALTVWAVRRYLRTQTPPPAPA
jgi:hypothetical protein